MHVSTDFRGVLKMTLNVLQRYAADSPSAKDIALELERSGGNMVALVAELEEQLVKEKAECERLRALCKRNMDYCAKHQAALAAGKG